VSIELLLLDAGQLFDAGYKETIKTNLSQNKKEKKELYKNERQAIIQALWNPNDVQGKWPGI